MEPLDLTKYRDLVIKDIEAHAEWREEVQHGKMFGFAVCERVRGQVPDPQQVSEKSGSGTCPLTLLKAYSGQILGRSDWEGYVPAIYDYLQPDGYFKTHEAKITAINNKVKELQTALLRSSNGSNSPRGGGRSRELEELKHERKERSQALQRWLFSQFRLTSPEGRQETVLKVFSDYARQTGSKQTVPPGGTGECCAPKLLNYANTHGLKVLQLAEFWYGDSPKGIIRHHGKFYEPCQAKCIPILGFLTPTSHRKRNQGVRPLDCVFDAKRFEPLELLFEDEWFVAINKPAHLLSVPGKRQLPNAQDMLGEQLNKRDKEACSFFESLRFAKVSKLERGESWVRPVHRLDQDTSGILLAAKTEEAFVAMQRQFAAHEEVHKEYIALVGGTRVLNQKTGTIRLPLIPDFLNRPMQKVDYEEGKEAITYFELITESRGLPPRFTPRFKHLFENEACFVVKLRPLTGRTHQLRVHCAHPDGLNMPIIGDPLYGNIPNDRMLLHASKLTFKHPFTGDIVTIESKPDFLPTE